MTVILSDDEVSDHESSSDKDGNFITFTATAIVDESVIVDKNPSDGELSENVMHVSSCKLQSEQISQKYLCLKYKILWYLLVSW